MSHAGDIRTKNYPVSIVAERTMWGVLGNGEGTLIVIVIVLSGQQLQRGKWHTNYNPTQNGFKR